MVATRTHTRTGYTVAIFDIVPLGARGIIVIHLAVSFELGVPWNYLRHFPLHFLETTGFTISEWTWYFIVASQVTR